MTATLGIHCGHDSSCAVVVDGRLVAAMQQERRTGRKHDGQECLTDDLPVVEVLGLAGLTLDDVDLVVSSFQAAGPGAVGMQRPLVAQGFSLFDPYDPRHLTVSHHRAHAASTAFASGFDDCAVLVSDLAGSTTIDGEDFFLPFAEVEARYREDPGDRGVRTEMRSVYRFTDGSLELLERDFGGSHNQPDVHVVSEASLYENVSQLVFRRGNAHGQLMALAGMSDGSGSPVTLADLVDTRGIPRLRNGWQFEVRSGTVRELAPLAHVAQEAFESVLVGQVERALRLTGCRDLATAGGVFLNLPANSLIADLPEVDRYYVPSAPHDAGISIGCAHLGDARAAATDGSRVAETHRSRPVSTDFFGPWPTHAPADLDELTLLAGDGDEAGLLRAVADVLCSGELVFRIAGRAEFGPRALGNRSILGHPVHCGDARARLNTIKGRQPWRPVAPLTLECHCRELFEGPASSPFMNMNYRVRTEHAQALREVVHADGTARVQTIADDDPGFVAGLVRHLAASSQVPVLLNTSLNGPGQPIINDVGEAISFARRSGVRHLLTEHGLHEVPDRGVVVLPDESVLLQIGSGGATAVSVHGVTVPVAQGTFEHLCSSFEIDATSIVAADYERLRQVAARAPARV